VLSLLALVAAIGPASIQAVRQSKTDKRWRRVLLGIVIGLTLVNYAMNNVDNARKNNQVMEKLEKLDRLLNASARPAGVR
jgi:hypothetical protein